MWPMTINLNPLTFNMSNFGHQIQPKILQNLFHRVAKDPNNPKNVAKKNNLRR